MSTILVGGIDISHSRLTELAKLADQAKPFHEWITRQFQLLLKSEADLTQIFMTATEEEILSGIKACYESTDTNRPLLADGIGRSYSHAKASYYYLSWLIRDAPQQRLLPLVTRVARASGIDSTTAQQLVLAKLIMQYRENVATFDWPAIREIVIDRLEGSRRSIKGHEKEVISRTALVTAFQRYHEAYGNYGAFASIDIPARQVKIGNETFDVSARLLDENSKCVARVLMPIKTRETEGGGHAHLFTRDVMSALNAIREENGLDYLVTVIVARNWASREAEGIRQTVDHAILFDMSPNEFKEFTDSEQGGLDLFIESLLSGKLRPKKLTI